MLICITGLKNSGKSTVAEYLRHKYGFHEIAFADEIYRQVAINFNVSEEQLRSREWKTTARPELALRNSADTEFMRQIVSSEMPDVAYNISPLCMEAQTCPRTGTFIIQRWATAYRRAEHGDNYWTELEKAKLLALPMQPINIVVSDLREPHELDFVGDLVDMYGAMRVGIIEITREGTVNTGHVSDAGLPRRAIDITIQNPPGNIPGLLSQVDAFIRQGIKWKFRATK